MKTLWRLTGLNWQKKCRWRRKDLNLSKFFKFHKAHKWENNHKSCFFDFVLLWTFFRKTPKPKISTNEKAGKKPRVWGYGDPNLDINSLDRGKDTADDAPTNFSPDTEVCFLKDYNLQEFFWMDHKRKVKQMKNTSVWTFFNIS